jgi:hypothetical protein
LPRYGVLPQRANRCHRAQKGGAFLDENVALLIRSQGAKWGINDRVGVIFVGPRGWQKYDSTHRATHLGDLKSELGRGCDSNPKVSVPMPQGHDDLQLPASDAENDAPQQLTRLDLLDEWPPECRQAIGRHGAALAEPRSGSQLASARRQRPDQQNYNPASSLHCLDGAAQGLYAERTRGSVCTSGGGLGLQNRRGP